MENSLWLVTLNQALRNIIIMNEVEFRHFVDRWPMPTGDLVTLAARIITPTGKRFLVVFHAAATIEGWDAIEIRRITDETADWLKDKHADDMFASELFGKLTGKYPYEVMETVKAEVTRHRSSELSPPR